MMSKGTLGDLCSDIVDCAHKTAPIDERGTHFAVGTPAMRGHLINYEEARRISRGTFDAWTTRLRPRYGDLLLAREAPVGPIVRIPRDENVAPGQRTVLLRPRPDSVDPQFLYYYLTSPTLQAELQVKASGSTVPHLNVADVRTLPTPDVPSLPEQRAIAEVLGALDDKIAANDRIISTAAALARSMFKRAATAGHVETIGNLAKLVTRGIAPKYTDDESALIVLNQKCIRDKTVSLDAARHTLTPENKQDRLLRANDVLVNSTGQGTLGRAARWTLGETATVDSHITIVRPDPEGVDPVCCGFAILEVEREIEGMAEGSTGQTELRRGLLSSLPVRIPAVDQQGSLGAELSKFDELVLRVRNESRHLARARDELLPLLMSGKIRVKDAEKIAGDVL